MIKVLYFGALWCMPCKQMTPVFELVTDQMQSDEIVFDKVDIDDKKELAQKYSIASIPQIVIIDKDGTELSRGGIMPPHQLTQFIKEQL